MALTTITNTNFDTACAAVLGPFGPLTRVDAVASVAPNSNLPVKVTSALSVTLYVSYEDLGNPEVLYPLLFTAHEASTLKQGYGYVLKFFAKALLAQITAAEGSGFTDAEVNSFLGTFRYLTRIVAMLPNVAWVEADATERVHISRAGADLSITASGATGTSTTKVFGNTALVGVDYGDGTPFELVTVNPTTFVFTDTHTYTVDGTYTVTIFAIGPGGFDILSKSLVVNVP